MSITNGVLSLCPLELEFIKDINLNKEDMYCVFLIGEKLLTSEMSASHEDHPRWEKHLINAELASDKDFVIYVYEKTNNSSDVLVAEATITLESAKVGGYSASWIDLEDADGNINGRIRLQMEFLGNLPASHIEGYIDAINKPLEEETGEEKIKFKTKSKSKNSNKGKISKVAGQDNNKNFLDKADINVVPDNKRVEGEPKEVQKAYDKGLYEARKMSYHPPETNSHSKKPAVNKSHGNKTDDIRGMVRSPMVIDEVD